MKVGAVCPSHPELEGLRRNSGHCVGCHRETLRAAYAKRVATEEGRNKHREFVKKACAKRVVDNPQLLEQKREYMREKRKNPEVLAKGREQIKKWRENNPGKSSWAARVRRDKVAQHTPRWADKEAIGAIYRKARELGLTVDHAIPLRGKNVSGLHVENNLQLLTRSENSSKLNSFQGD